MKKQDIYNAWAKLKVQIDSRRKIPHVKKGQIWWCSVGENIGNETNGKGETFRRPVLVIKVEEFTFIGVPLTSAGEENAYRIAVTTTPDKNSYANISNIRTYSKKRLIEKMGKLSPEDLAKVKRKLKEYLS